MNQSYESLMKRLAKEVEEEIAWSGNRHTAWITPKRGVVVQRSEWAPSWVEGPIKIRGKWYPLLANAILPPRPVSQAQATAINGEPRYLDLKGYGLRGQTMFFNEHESGDIFYGMYLENARIEFERLLVAARAGLPVPLPIAVVEIPREEYLRQGLKGFEEVVATRLYWSLREDMPDWLVNIAGKRALEQDRQNGPYKATARRLVSWIRQHPEGIERGVEIAMSNLNNRKKPRDSMFNNAHRSADALLNKRAVGYLIRASKCPIRVGDPSDPAIDTPENRKVAVVMGKAFQKLLEIGLLHHCPGTGNWTKAGELTDLQDTFDLAKEQNALALHVQMVKKNDMRQFVRYLLGPEHTGVLCRFFLEGVCAKPASLEEATDKVLCSIQ